MSDIEQIRTGDDIRDMLRDDIEASGLTQNKYAELVGCHPVYLSLVLNGHKEPTPSMARRLGYERVWAYRKVGR